MRAGRINARPRDGTDRQRDPGGPSQQQAITRPEDHRSLRRECDALRKALEAAENQARAQQELTAMAVHDIRAPTTVISGLTEVLQHHAADLDPAQLAGLLATIMRNSERIERLIDDLLTLARLGAGGFSYDLEPVDLPAVLEEVTTEIRQATTRTVDVVADPDLPPALADADRQVQILHNLLSNAAKFSPNGTPISVRITQRGDHLLVHVSDQGRGIPTHELHKLFTPFARLDSSESDKVEGNGLGLYITKMLVEGQQGTIDIESTPGRGTTITYTVPIADTS